MGHTSDIHCVGAGAGADHDDDDDVLIGLPDVAREAEKEEKKNSSHAAHRSQGQNEALVQGFPGNAAAKLEDGSPPGEPDGTRISPMVPMPPPAFGDNDEDLGIRDIDAELEAAIEESRGSIQLKLNRLVEELFCAAFIYSVRHPIILALKSKL